MADRSAVVVGAGPSGLVSALALRADGVDVSVLEAQPEQRLRPGSRAIYIHGSSLGILERIRPGLGHRLSAAGVTWSRKSTFWKGHEVYRKTYPAAAAGALPHFTSLAQHELERILTAECQASGVRFRWDAAVSWAETRDDSVILHTQRGRVVESEFVIAADGPRSAMRRSLGVKMSGSRSSNAFVVADVEDDPEHPLPLERRFHYEHPALGGRNVLVVPFSGGWRLDLQCEEGDRPIAFSSAPGLQAWLGKVLPPGHAHRVTWVTTYNFMQVVAERFTDIHHRVLLVGEAAHLFSPFGARGLNSGIADAEAAAKAVAAAAACGDNARPAIASYDRERRAVAEVNRRQSTAGLAAIQGRERSQRWRRLLAARLASLGHHASGRWLDAAPYGATAVPAVR